MTHAFDIGIHPRPVEAQLKAMECPVGIEVAANRICVECNEDDIHEL